MQQLPEQLKGEWWNLDKRTLTIPHDHKFVFRENTLNVHWPRLHHWIPEYLKGRKRRFMDVSCGNGASMEILKYYGHEVMGLDFSPGYPPGDWMYRPLIESQKLPCVVHDMHKLPMPFADKEFDVLINYAAMNFYKPSTIWPEVLNEFARITRECLFVVINDDQFYEEGRRFVESWSPPGFMLARRHNSYFKWIKRPGA